ncbi:uncharacterized protein K460DRAFT_399947 [Cucurbitaria berberidis CBS 394.84]|uniref:Tctex-1 n=1 Tax=Cucurbitaria berberidis CBS 394.84 TaxID=1168544 RepID=A0A9P4GNP3_9PLEO|nr:uncharacterized protein K460DRAFT_399947 [Cucurbitaria berberidis CBS 394.84]KAF1849838.1 hypothetical protein K460DRAFT_399947 [Cucurbitaria berberidis CBS 394.84]
MASQSPLPTAELEQIASSACEQAIGASEAYDHTKVADWNTTIIVSKSPIRTPVVAQTHTRDRLPFAFFLVQPKSPTKHVNNTTQQTILKTLIAKTSHNASSPDTKVELSPEAGQPAYKYIANSTVIQHIGSPSEPEKHGRRGMHSAVGAFWNNEKDGTYSYKWEGAEKKGMDIVITITWIAI